MADKLNCALWQCDYISGPKESIDVAYLDFSKAFEQVDHGFLLDKLNKVEIMVLHQMDSQLDEHA